MVSRKDALRTVAHCRAVAVILSMGWGAWDREFGLGRASCLLVRRYCGDSTSTKGVFGVECRLQCR